MNKRPEPYMRFPWLAVVILVGLASFLATCAFR